MAFSAFAFVRQTGFYHLQKFSKLPNGLRYLRVGGRGFCLRAGKTRSEKNA